MAKPKSKIVETVGKVTGLSMATAVGQFTMHTELPPDHAFYAMVGRVASEWAQLEHVLDSIIYELVNSRNKRSTLPANVLACITSQIMGVGPRCKAIILLAGHCRLDEKSIVKPLKTLMSDSYKPADDRARFVHDPWYIEVSTNVPAQFRAMPYSDPTYGFRDVTPEDATRVIRTIQDLQGRAMKLRSAVRDALRSSE